MLAHKNLVKSKIYLDRIRENYIFLKHRCRAPIPIVKADAYGHGILPVAQLLIDNGAQWLGVAVMEECFTLRKIFDGRILAMLGPLTMEEMDFACSQNITSFIHNYRQLEMLFVTSKKYNRPINIALKINTGMNRLGFSIAEVPNVLQLISEYPIIKIEMLCSHLSTADSEDVAFVHEQELKFNQAYDICEKSKIHPARCFVNSAGILAYPESHFEFQRTGISLYGANPFWGTAKSKLGSFVFPAMEVVSKIVEIRNIEVGETVGYNRNFCAERPSKIAVVGAGYSTNYSRRLSNKAQVLINKMRAPIIGNICMELMMVDITDIPSANIDSEVVLLGGVGANAIRPEELASWLDTISYEVMCLLGQNYKEYIYD